VYRIFLTFIFLFFLLGCREPLMEVKENIFSAQDNTKTENEFNCTIEAITDWVLTNRFNKKSERILPGYVQIIYNDSTFMDLDGVEGMLDFGAPGNSKPFGMLCSDGKYRSGRIRFKLNQHFEIPGAKLELFCEAQDSFCSGSGDEMNSMTGLIIINNPDGMSILLSTENLLFKDSQGFKTNWSCKRKLTLVKDAGQGVWGDIYSMEGIASGTNRENEMYEVTIETPLIKKMELGCSKTFVTGSLSIKNLGSEKIILVDYDPFNDGRCDRIAEAEINGKKTIYKID